MDRCTFSYLSRRVFEHGGLTQKRLFKFIEKENFNKRWIHTYNFFMFVVFIFNYLKNKDDIYCYQYNWFLYYKKIKYYQIQGILSSESQNSFGILVFWFYKHCMCVNRSSEKHQFQFITISKNNYWLLNNALSKIIASTRTNPEPIVCSTGMKKIISHLLCEPTVWIPSIIYHYTNRKQQEKIQIKFIIKGCFSIGSQRIKGYSIIFLTVILCYVCEFQNVSEGDDPAIRKTKNICVQWFYGQICKARCHTRLIN